MVVQDTSYIMIYISKFQFSSNNSYLRAATMTRAQADEVFEDFHLYLYHCNFELPSSKSNNCDYMQVPHRSS